MANIKISESVARTLCDGVIVLRGNVERQTLHLKETQEHLKDVQERLESMQMKLKEHIEFLNVNFPEWERLYA